MNAKTLKALQEKRAAHVKTMSDIIEGAKAEERGITEEEHANFDAADAEIRSIDATLAAEKRALELIEQGAPAESEQRAENADETSEPEKRAFTDYIKKECKIPIAEVRSGEQNFDYGNNGAIMPTSIAQTVINEVKEMCPILAGATNYAVKGTLKVPVYGNADTTHNITVGFQKEFSDLTADAGKFTSVDLTGHTAGALTLIGKSVLNNSEIDVYGFIISELSRRIARWIEGVLLAASTTVDADTSTTISGALSTTNTLLAGSVSAISADNLIDLQAKVPTQFQANACWTMAPATFTVLRKLKDANGQYLLQTASGMVNGFGYMLLGKPVYLSDNMPAIASAAKPILYGDYSGLSVNFRQQIETQVLLEKYSNQHAIGINAWFEFDAAMTDSQRLAALVMSVS